MPTAPFAWPGPQGMTTDHVIARGPAPATEATGGPAGSRAVTGTAHGAGSSVLVVTVTSSVPGGDGIATDNIFRVRVLCRFGQTSTKATMEI